jgi:hypothetical protein
MSSTTTEVRTMATNEAPVERGGRDVRVLPTIEAHMSPPPSSAAQLRADLARAVVLRKPAHA